MNNDIQLQADFTLNQQPDIQADFKIITTGAAWGQINGDITNQTDLINLVNNATSTYTHEQGIASDTWVIEHNLNKRPSYTVVDSTGKVIMPDEIIYDSNNQITLQFISAFAGEAYLN